VGKKRPTRESARERLRDLYGFDFPDDFFRFREFLAALPDGLLAEAADLRPAFPFAAADGKRPTDHPKNPLWEDRYYDDPPEFVTLFHGGTDGLHWGYHFDDPGRLPPVVVHYYSRDAYQYGEDGDDVWEAVRHQVESSHRDFEEGQENEEDEPEYYEEKFEELEQVRAVLARHWPARRPEVGEDYLDRYGVTRRKATAPTWDGLGVVLQKKQYRPLKADPIARKPGRIEPNARAVPGAAEEALKLTADGYPGAALQLGRELWVFPDHFGTSYRLLDAAYEALGREPLRRLQAAARGWREHCDAQRKPRG
jgi:hypothetical protein